ncbi:MAG: ABC transporter permease [Promethearchaeota archaeon]
MHLWNYFFSIFKKHKIRYFACILGFGVSLGAVFGISAYSALLDDSVNRVYMMSENSYMVMAKGTNVVQVLPLESQIPDNISDIILNFPGVIYTLPVIFKDFGNKTNFKFLKNIIVGINFDNLQNLYLKNVGLQEGNWPQDPLHEIVVGPNVKYPNLAVNSTIPIRGVNFTVSGILMSTNVFFDKFIYVDYEETQQLFEMEGLCSVMYVLGDSSILNTPDLLQNLENTVESQFPSVNFIDSEELNEATGFFYQMLDVFNIIMSVFPLFISGLFIFILMLLNVKEQEREFGMLRAIGMPLSNIGIMVFLQGIFITGVGYLVSLLTGNFYFMYGFYVFQGDNTTIGIIEYTREMMNLIPQSIYFQTLFISLVVGMIIAVYPSIRAMKQSIVQTFRKEE